jgi:hypothetical protein
MMPPTHVLVYGRLALGFANPSFIPERKDRLPVVLHIDNRPAFRLGFVERLVQFAKR